MVSVPRYVFSRKKPGIVDARRLNRCGRVRDIGIFGNIYPFETKTSGIWLILIRSLSRFNHHPNPPFTHAYPYSIETHRFSFHPLHRP